MQNNGNNGNLNNNNRVQEAGQADRQIQDILARVAGQFGFENAAELRNAVNREAEEERRRRRLNEIKNPSRGA